jgi:hypothetical protein
MKAEIQAQILALQVQVNIDRGIDDLNAGRTRSSQELLERYRTTFH